MKFKIGDKVRVRKRKDLTEKYPKTIFGWRIGTVDSDGDVTGMELTHSMLEFCDRVVTITETSNDRFYRIKEDGGVWAWVDEMFEGKVEDNEEVEDVVNNPSHYTHGEYEVIDVIEDWKLNYRLGNAIKYIARCEHKGNKKQDLEKAIWYLRREIDKGE